MEDERCFISRRIGFSRSYRPTHMVDTIYLVGLAPLRYNQHAYASGQPSVLSRMFLSHRGCIS